MRKNGRRTLAGALALSLGCALFLTGCGANEKGVQAAKKAAGTTVRNEVGFEDSYTGVVDPQLEANYVQSDAEARKYGAEMENILKNGLGADRELQSGI